MAASTSTDPARDTLDAQRWTRAGLAELTGAPDGPPLGPPAGFLPRLDALTDRIRTASSALGQPVQLDGTDALTARVELLGLRRRGQVSCGGACHLVEAADGWLAASLSRPDDWELLAAWLGLPPGGGGERWPEVHERCARLRRDEVVARGALLGLPVAALGEAAATPERPSVLARTVGRSPRPRGATRLRVADLSSMWAGPLCGSVLARAGAEVLKAESVTRPDGARGGPAELYELLNGAKEEVRLDLGSPGGVGRLQQLLRTVDVVIESARPRALRQLGVRAEELLADPAGPTVWVSITGYGREGPGANRVAFGDDAAVAGGLVGWWEQRPTFCADAIADPLTGLTAAAAALEALAAERPVLLDVAMSRVAAHFAGAAPR